MIKKNAAVGGPAFVELLAQALDRRAQVSTRPPSTGGTQVSLRFAQDRLGLLDKLATRSGWNRNQIVEALVDTGLVQLFDRLSEATANAIIDELVRADSMRRVAAYVRENARFYVRSGPAMSSPEDVQARVTQIQQIADQLDELAARKGPAARYSEFEGLRGELQKVGFNAPGELVSAVVEAFLKAAPESQ